MSNEFEIVVKSVNDSGPGEWTAVASSPFVDRDDEVMDTATLKFRDKVPSHYPHFGDLVGSGRPVFKGGLLHFQGIFARTPKAQEVRQLVKDGHLHAMSVHVIGAKSKYKDGRRHIVDGELVAVDFVNVGSNREALVSAVRSYSPTHDATQMAVANGALALARAQMLLLDMDEVNAKKRARMPWQAQLALLQADELLGRLPR